MFKIAELSHANGFINWLEQHLLTCRFKRAFGIDCLGCGMQRSIIALFKGDIFYSFKLYPPTMPLLILIIFTTIHLKANFKYGVIIIKFLFFTTVVVILGNFFYKIINHITT